MSIASRIQEIETHIGDVYDTINYSYDTTGVNKNIINIPKYLKKGYIDIINNGIDTLYNNFPKVSGIGSNLSLTPTYEAPMKLNEIQGDTLQDGTPTPDTPIEIQSVTGLQNIEVCGKNLFDIKDSTSISSDLTATINNGIVSISGTSTATSFLYVIKNTLSLSAGTYTISAFNNSSYSDNKFDLRITEKNGNGILGRTFLNTTNSSATFTLTTDLVEGCLQVRANSGDTFNNFTLTPMLEKGSSSSSYEEYKGNTYEVNLGKNLFDKDNINEVRGTINADSKIFTYSSTSMNYCFYMPCKPNTTYTIQKRNDGDTNRFKFASCSIEISTQESAVTNLTSRISDDSASSLTITTGENDKYLLVQYYRSAETTLTKQQLLDSIQIEEGTVPTPYSSYFTPIELNKIGDYQDTITGTPNNWSIKRQIGSITLNGSENWSNGTSGGWYRFYTPINEAISSSGRQQITSNYFHFVSSGNEVGAGFISSNNLFLYPEQTISTTSDFQTWLSTHNTEVKYVLATPIYEVITNEELINQLESLNNAKSEDGTTNIVVTSENLPMILNASALKNEE